MNKILIVTPTYNELANIENLFDAIFVRHPDVHILVVDDSSPDGTGDFVKNHKFYEKSVFLISRPGKWD